MLSLRLPYWALTLSSLVLGFVFWLANLFYAASYECAWAEEYYWISDGREPSLFATLFFSVLLLGWWSLWIPFSDRLQKTTPTRGEIAALVSNYALIATLGLVLWALWDRISIDNHFRYGTIVEEPRFDDYFGLDDRAVLYFASIPPECLKDDPFVGIWAVQEMDDYDPGFVEINLWRNKTFEKHDDSGIIIETGRWDGPDWFGQRIRFWTEHRMEFWNYTIDESQTQIRLELTPYRPDAWWKPYASVTPMPKKITLVRKGRPYNSAPRELGDRLILEPNKP